MVAQSVLPFKLEITKDQITAHSGLVMFGEFAHAMNLPQQIDRLLPSPGSAVGYQPSKFIMPLLLMLHGGGRSIEDLRQIRNDAGLCDLLGMHSIPGSHAYGRWFPRMGGSDGISALNEILRNLIARAINVSSRKEFTLDIDATQIIAEKKAARVTYKGEVGYMPMVGTLAEAGIIIGEEFREGNNSPSNRNYEFLLHCVERMPKNKRIAAFRADSAAYQAKIFNWCEHHGVQFAVGASKDKSVKPAIAALNESDWRPFRDGHIAEFVHSMNETENAFRMIVFRRPQQQDMFDDESNEPFRHTVIASNRTESPEEIIRWYNKRGEHSENRIKDLKIGFGMERMPCGTFAGNAMFFRIGVLAYNLFVLFKLYALPESWKRCQIQTVRWRLYNIAGKITSHAGYLRLKVGRNIWTIFGNTETIT